MRLLSALVTLLVLLLFVDLGRAAHLLPVGRATDGTIEAAADHVSYRFQAVSAGILTVAVRTSKDAEGTDLTLSVVRDGPVDLLPPGWEEGASWSDSDLQGDAGAEQLAVTIPAPGEYLVRVASLEAPATYRLVASFVPFPEVERKVDEVEAVKLAVGKPHLATVDVDQTMAYELAIGADGWLVVVSRGSGDVGLAAINRGNGARESRVLATCDNDQFESMADESLVVRVSKGETIQVLVRGIEDSRYAIVGQLVQLPAEFAELAEEAARALPEEDDDEQPPEVVRQSGEGRNNGPARAAARLFQNLRQSLAEQRQ